MADHRSKLAAIVREHEPKILADWIDLVTKGGTAGAMDRGEVETQARSLVRLLADAVQADGNAGIDGPAWAKVRDLEQAKSFGQQVGRSVDGEASTHP